MSEKYWEAYDIHSKVKKIGVWIAGVATFFMMIFICADVFMRNITGSSIPGSYEIIQGYIMALTTFTAIPYAYSAGVMPRVDLIVNKFKPHNKQLAINCMLIIDIIIFVAFTIISAKYAVKSFVDKTTFIAGTKYYPVYPLHIMPPVAFILIVIEDLFVLTRNIKENMAAMFTGIESSKGARKEV